MTNCIHECLWVSYVVHMWERRWDRMAACFCMSADTARMCSCVCIHTRQAFPMCVWEGRRMCMLLWHIESIPKLCSLQCSRGLGATHLSFWSSAVGHSYGDPDWQSLPNPGGRTRLIGSEQIWGRVEMKDKEVCLRVWILLMRLRCTPATVSLWYDSWTCEDGCLEK